jgi:hypothetical protein
MRTFLNLAALMAVGLLILFGLHSCSRNQHSSTDASARLQVSLTDGPFTHAKEVWVDIQQISIIMDDTTKPIVLAGSHPGMYNLMNFTNGKDTLLADASIPPGNISQIRLVLGDNNYIIDDQGNKITLKTPSGQESGLKVQVHQPVTGGILYRLVLDFDAGRSIVQAGNSGNFLLKPVLRIISFAPSGGDIQGVVVPDSFRSEVIAIQGTDTFTTFTDTLTGDYLFKDVPAGNYSLQYIPSDTSFKWGQSSTTVTLGQISMVDTVVLHK